MTVGDKHFQQTLWGTLGHPGHRCSVVLQAEAEEKESGGLEVTRTAAEAAFLEHFSSDDVSRMVQNQVRAVVTWLATCIRHGCCWPFETKNWCCSTRCASGTHSFTYIQSIRGVCLLRHYSCLHAKASGSIWGFWKNRFAPCIFRLHTSILRLKSLKLFMYW